MVTSDEIEALVLRAQAGDRPAFDSLVENYRGRLESAVRARIGAALRGRLDPADVVGETHLRALQSIAKFRFRGDDSFYRWLCRIAEHLIWNAAKKRSGKEDGLIHDVVSEAVSPSRGLRREERLKRLEAALRKLPPDQRKAIQLAKIDGLKVREIATRMERSSAAIKQLLSRGLRELKSSFGETESLHLPAGPEDGHGDP